MSQFEQYATAMSEFHLSQAYKKLSALAKRPYDLSVPGNVNPERIRRCCVQGGDLSLVYAMERVDDETVDALKELAKERNVFEKMFKMQSGAVMNPGENRQVLHTAMRDFFDAPISQPEAAEAAQQAKAQNDKLKAFIAANDQEETFTDMVLVGIGGSDLGPRSVYYALEAFKRENRHVHFISNVDPDDAAAVMKGLDLAKTCAVVVSKSGTTIETLTNEEIVRHHFKEAGLDPNAHLLAVTGKGSQMDDPSRYRDVFLMWDYVGGRYSTTSMVGGVILSFALGHQVFTEFLRGCSAMDKIALERDVTKNLPLFGALLGVWNRNFLKSQTAAVIPYSQALWRLPAHLQQLDMESNGKRVDTQGVPVSFETGPIIWGEPGTNGQHSFYQLIHQGTDVIPVEFICFKEPQRGEDLDVQGTSSQQKLLANVFAQSIALACGKEDDNPNKVFPGNRPNRLLIANQLTPYTLGNLFAYFEHKVAFQGFIWGVNSFDQEGVQLGKVLANKVLASMRGDTPFPLGDALMEHLPD